MTDGSTPVSSVSTPPPTDVQSPPHTLWGTLARLGPGMIIAGSIVGSGELIATTSVGAKAGFALLWLIIVGCVIKVFVQVEIGRYTVAHGRSSLEAIDSLPGPRVGAHVFVWFYLIVTLFVLAQQGGIVGGVGQALTVGWPLTDAGKEYKAKQDDWVEAQVSLGQRYKGFPQLRGTEMTLTRMLDLRFAARPKPRDPAKPDVAPVETEAEIKARTEAQTKLDNLLARRRGLVGDVAADAFEPLESGVTDLRQTIAGMKEPKDPYIWATIIAVVTAVLLYIGRYGLIQWISTALVAGFTVMTVLTLVMLQTKPDWAVTGHDFVNGIRFSVPPNVPGEKSSIVIALGAFGIIGVGAVELVMYPYWCLEKGYAKWTGPNDGSETWTDRAKGWMRVMRFDAWFSMVVYTFATVAFFLLGAAVLGRSGLVPEGGSMVRLLSEMYVPVFGGKWAQWVFLIGAFAVLYSTYFVASAGNARILADAMGIVGLVKHDEASRQRWTRAISVIWPLAALLLYWFVKAPVAMVLASGIGQMLLLPMLGTAALYFRYKRCERRLRPTMIWDLFLWISVAGFFVVAGSYLWIDVIKPLLKQ